MPTPALRAQGLTLARWVALAGATIGGQWTRYRLALARWCAQSREVVCRIRSLPECLLHLSLPPPHRPTWILAACPHLRCISTFPRAHRSRQRGHNSALLPPRGVLLNQHRPTEWSALHRAPLHLSGSFPPNNLSPFAHKALIHRACALSCDVTPSSVSLPSASRRPHNCSRRHPARWPPKPLYCAPPSSMSSFAAPCSPATPSPVRPPRSPPQQQPQPQPQPPPPKLMLPPRSNPIPRSHRLRRWCPAVVGQVLPQRPHAIPTTPPS